ncbi:MAG: hypothetical protein R3C13_11705 [Hyphomonas sp.]|uniref:hypothetical protein n=1 Tax=Hyphomonas sp. TaxID=87 RepID=UPI003528227E
MSSGTLESRLFRRSFDDGWLDVLVGTGIALTGLFWILDWIAPSAAIPAVLIPFWKIGRDRIVEPRLGHVAFTAERKAETRRSLTGWAAFGVGVLALEICLIFLLPRQGGVRTDLLSNAAVAIPVLLIAVGLLAGLMIGARRFAVYAVLAGAVGFIGALLGIGEPGYLILSVGLVILAAGCGRLFRFLQTHPATIEAGRG